MILKQITNHQDKQLSLGKKIQVKRAMQTKALSYQFNCIFKTSHEQIEIVNYNYTNAIDPLFIARCNQVEWMFSQQIIMDLDDDTVFEAILLMDKYISLKKIEITQIQKLAAVCLILSSKVNQIYPIRLKKLNQISKQCYTNSQYTQLQTQILILFQFNLPHGSIYQIFKLYQSFFNLQTTLKKDASLFVLRKCILDYDLLVNGVRATALAAISYLCHLKRIIINSSFLSSTLISFSPSLSRITQLINQAKKVNHNKCKNNV